LVIIVDIVINTAENEEVSNEIIVNIAKGVEWDIRDLLRWLRLPNLIYYETIIDCCSTLRTINEDLDDLPPRVHGY